MDTNNYPTGRKIKPVQVKAVPLPVTSFTEGLGATLRGTYGAAGALGGFSAGTRAVGAAVGGTAGATGAPRTGTALVPKAISTLGQWGEARLAQILGGRGYKPTKAFKTSLGPRFVDRVIGRTAYEAKAGIDVKLTSRIQLQIDKDAELLATGQFDEIVWYFSRAPRRTCWMS